MTEMVTKIQESHDSLENRLEKDGKKDTTDQKAVDAQNVEAQGSRDGLMAGLIVVVVLLVLIDVAIVGYIAMFVVKKQA